MCVVECNQHFFFGFVSSRRRDERTINREVHPIIIIIKYQFFLSKGNKNKYYQFVERQEQGRARIHI